jgi:DNA-binding winged helix-turn-helix (wHTH) protein
VRIHFGDYVLDSGTRELSRRRRAVAISPKALRLLEILLERRPEAVSKEELHALLWPGVFVAEGNLARLMTEIRGAVGDHAQEPRLIRTVQRFGYAFSGDAQQGRGSTSVAPRSGVFKLIWGDREIALSEGENVLGRDESSVAWIDVHSVSRHHARIVIRGEKAVLEDLGSKNGTFHRGKKVLKPVAVGDGDEIRIGTVPLTFRRFAPGVSTKTTHVR